MGHAQPSGGHAPGTSQATTRRFRLEWPVRVILLGTLIVVLAVPEVLLRNVAHTAGVGLGLGVLPVGGLGLVIARRQPGNPIGWLLAGFSAALILFNDVSLYAVFDYHLRNGGLPLGPAAALIASELWIAFFLVLPLVILLFPDGRLESRWRTTLLVYLTAGALIIAALFGFGAWEMSGTRIVVDGHGQLVPNPFPSGAATIPVLILLGSVPLFWASFVVRQVLSWRRSSGERKAQLKWLMTGSSVTVVALAGTFLLAQVSGPLASALGNVLLGLGLFSLPASIGIGILKYHLYDIDRLISRTFSYTLLTGLLIGLYAGLVTLATRVLPHSSPVGVAASTLAVAALFNPLRRRLQRIVDRRFNRARYDAEAIVAVFAARLTSAVDLDLIGDDLADVVRQALEPAHVSVWISRG